MLFGGEGRGGEFLKAKSQRPLDYEEGYKGKEIKLSSQNTTLVYYYQAALFSSDVAL